MKTQNFDGVQSFGQQPLWRLRVTINHFLRICISEKILWHFLAHIGPMKTGYAIQPYCVKREVHRGGEYRYRSTLSLTSWLDWGRWSTLCPGCFTLLGMTLYPLYRRLGGPQGWSGWAWKILPPPSPNGIRSLDHPACNELIYQLHYLCPPVYCVGIHSWGPSDTNHLTSWYNYILMHILHTITVQFKGRWTYWNWTFSLCTTVIQYVLKFYDYGEKLIYICILHAYIVHRHDQSQHQPTQALTIQNLWMLKSH